MAILRENERKGAIIMSGYNGLVVPKFRGKKSCLVLPKFRRERKIIHLDERYFVIPSKRLFNP